MKKNYIIPLLFLILVIPSITSGKIVDRVVAIVNNDVITLSDLEALKDSDNIDDNKVKKEKELDKLIEKKLIEQEVKRLNLEVTQEDVNKAVKNILNENSFSIEELEKLLKGEESDLDTYKDELKDQIQKAKIINHEFKSELSVSEEEGKSYYLKHLKVFQEVREIRLGHILFKVPSNAGEKKIKEIREKANKVLKKIKEGENFPSLAMKYSEDDTSASMGGDIGFIRKGMLLAPLEDVAFTLHHGEVSKLIKSDYGFHILKLTESKEAKQMPFSSVSNKIHDILLQEKLERLFEKWVEKLRLKSVIEIKL